MKNKINKNITKNIYQNEQKLINFMRFVNGKKLVVQAKTKEEAEKKFAELSKQSDN